MDSVGLVNATERLYRALFTAAVGFALGAALWGMALAPLNDYNDHLGLSLTAGAALAGAALAAFVQRAQLFVLLRRRPAWLLAVVLISVAVLWLDGGWRTSYYLASYAAIALAAVGGGGLRWSVPCAVLLATGYVTGLAVGGYAWADFVALNETDAIVAYTLGYFVAAYFLAAPVTWLGGYVARIHQVVGGDADRAGPRGLIASLARKDSDWLTDKLSVREVEVVQLVAGGATNEEIAARLGLSPRTIQSHVKHATEKTGTRNRTELAVLAVMERLVPEAGGTATRPSDLVLATERLYRALFGAAVGLSLGTVLWGTAIAPFNPFNDHGVLSFGIGVGLLLAAGVALRRRERLFLLLRRAPAALLVAVAVSVAVLWIDGGFRSSYQLASYNVIGLAAVVGGRRWSFACAAPIAAGYVAGLALNGYSWADLEAMRETDSVVMNVGGYLLAAYFLATPVAWLGGYVARINQIVGVDSGAAGTPGGSPAPAEARRATDALSVREVEVVQLVAGGATNEEIAARLVLSPRTIQSHVQSAMQRTGARNRTELAVLAVREGLVPSDEGRRTPALSETPASPA